MIAYLNGKITQRTPTYIYVECGGVGYHVNISLHTYSRLESLESIKILTYHHVREDEQSLYGFFDDEERLLFVQLISVSGIGVNTARVILSYMTPDEVRTAILHENAVALSKVKGIGPKTAKQIILDLKEKVMKTGVDIPTIQQVSLASNTIKDEALAALVALGFPKAAVEKHIKHVFDKQPDISLVEDLIKNVLKQMN